MATIMIVEDEQAIALLLKYNLEKNGYTTITVSHGNRVLSALDEEEIEEFMRIRKKLNSALLENIDKFNK